MNHYGSILCQPDELIFNYGAYGRIQFLQLRIRRGTYFDGVGHCVRRGRHGLNLPARSSWRASRNSRMTCGFCAVSQSCNSSRVSTEESTGTGIWTTPLGIRISLSMENGESNP
jgi:hypothetical protein